VQKYINGFQPPVGPGFLPEVNLRLTPANLTALNHHHGGAGIHASNADARESIRGAHASIGNPRVQQSHRNFPRGDRVFCIQPHKRTITSYMKEQLQKENISVHCPTLLF